jgi:hypothetical protein
MKPIRLLIAALALIGLAGCYTSDTPLVGDDEAVTPFEKITFQGKGPDDKPVAFTHDGKGYLSHGDSEGSGGDMRMHLKPVEGDFYVVQLSGEGGDGKTEYLYGYMRIDVANKVADVYKMVGTKDDVRPGMHECKDVVCIDDLAAYIAYAKEGIAAGGAPDTTFAITVE